MNGLARLIEVCSLCQVDPLHKAIGATCGMIFAFRTYGVFSGNSVVASLANFPLFPAASFLAGESIMRVIPVAAFRVPAGACLSRTCCHIEVFSR